MNEEVIKAMNRKPKEEKEHKFRKWWDKNGYKVMRVVFFPIWLIILAQRKITAKLNARNKWNEKRAKELFDYYIPRRADWVPEEKLFFYFDNGMGWDFKLAKRNLKRKDYRFWKMNSGWSGGQLRQFLAEKYELEGFTKEVVSCESSGWTKLRFRMIEK